MFEFLSKKNIIESKDQLEVTVVGVAADNENAKRSHCGRLVGWRKWKPTEIIFSVVIVALFDGLISRNRKQGHQHGVFMAL